MASLDLDLVRHALKTAQEHGFAEVELGIDGESFKARFEPGRKSAKTASKPSETAANPNPDHDFLVVKSPLVGFYRPMGKVLEVGASITKGEVVAVVNALGIANDIESQVTGEVVEVLVEDGQPVEFGQPLAKVKA